MKPTRTKTLLLASSIALLTTPAYAWTNEAHVLGGRAEFTDTNAKRRHHAKPRQAKAHYAKARHAKQQQIKRRAVERRNRSKTAHQPAGYDAFASLPDQHAVATGYDQHAVVMTGSYVPVRHTPTRVKRRTVERQAVERKSRPQGVRQHAGYDLIASQQRDQHSVEQGFYYPPVNYAPARRTPTPYASAHHAPPPIRSATRSHRVARTYHTEPATERQAVERKSRPQAARQHAGYNAFASLPDQHAVVHGYSYAPARRAPAPYASTHYAPAPSHAATRAHTVAHTYHTEPGSSGGSDLVARARQYMGTNPTGWARVWCGRFMAMIAPDAAARIGNPNFALNWAKLPRTGLQIGAIAVLSRNGGGHVGVVSGIDAHGNPIIISGNHNKRVAEAVYPRSRVYAYVRPY